MQGQGLQVHETCKAQTLLLWAGDGISNHNHPKVAWCLAGRWGGTSLVPWRHPDCRLQWSGTEAHLI